VNMSMNQNNKHPDKAGIILKRRASIDALIGLARYADFTAAFLALRLQLYQYVTAPFSVRVAPCTKAAITTSFSSAFSASKMAIAASALDLPSLMSVLPLAMASLIDCLFISIFFGSAATTGAGTVAGISAAAGEGSLTAVGVTTGAFVVVAFGAGLLISLVMIISP
jgi:hypothetical protein